ncbi:hypothetical protein COLO4_22144 [Corchorus olitorius]|uniref:PROP1-like PPR domain-containing protein n=1 Tax=Corchorus olitorius TaxID=93759 RepID=A0A1R3INU5_9ROSI|nr:hypothetical protein COLO4_22144 [Corchorus olitorius]
MESLDVEPKVYMRDTIWNIYKILKYTTWDSAETQLKQLPVKWDSFTVNQVLKTHPPMEKAWLFFNWVGKVRGFKHDQFTYTTILDIFGEAGRTSSMKYLFQQMQEKELKIDAVTYTSILHWLSKSGDVDGAVEMWDEMRGKRCFPTVVSYTAYMKVLFDNNRVKEGTAVYKEMLQSGISPNCHTYTVLMEYRFGAGKYDEALDIFNKMQDAGVKPDKAACNILVEKCCKAGETRAMIKILQYMKENYVEKKLSMPSMVLKLLLTAKYATEAPFDTELVGILLKKKNLLAIDSLLTELMNKDIRFGL